MLNLNTINKHEFNLIGTFRLLANNDEYWYSLRHTSIMSPDMILSRVLQYDG